MIGQFLAGIVTVAFALTAATDAAAQHEGHEHEAQADRGEEQHDEHGTSASQTDEYLMAQSSGTATQPASWPMPMLMTERGGWGLAFMGELFLVHTHQGGPRGRDDTFATNWGMASALRRMGPGSFQARLMSSLEPATVPNRAYPLLFQTGETAYGRPIVDGQHPHDFVMELSAQYALPVGRRGIFNVYYAPVGDVALGPASFPHRASAMELPQATLGHHWQDSTHIATNVLTVGFARPAVRIEASTFHGTEPDEGRWDIDMAAMNSWSARATVAPHSNWMAQASVGRLEAPERSHRADDVVRTTASVQHIRPFHDGRSLASSLIWARNRKSVSRVATQTVTFETLVPVASFDHLTARVEWSQRDELFENDHELAERIEEETGRSAFDVTALTVGYSRDLARIGHVRAAIGATGTAYWMAEELKPFYGRRPWSATVFLRLRLWPQGGGHQHQ